MDEPEHLEDKVEDKAEDVVDLEDLEDAIVPEEDADETEEDLYDEEAT